MTTQTELPAVPQDFMLEVMSRPLTTQVFIDDSTSDGMASVVLFVTLGTSFRQLGWVHYSYEPGSLHERDYDVRFGISSNDSLDSIAESIGKLWSKPGGCINITATRATTVKTFSARRLRIGNPAVIAHLGRAEMLIHDRRRNPSVVYDRQDQQTVYGAAEERLHGLIKSHCKGIV